MYQLGSDISDTSEKDDRQPLLPPYGRRPSRTPSSSLHQSVWKRRHETYRWAWILVSTLLIAFTGTIIFIDPGHSTDFSLSPEGLEYSAWKHLRNHVSLLDVPSITREEFLARQKTLATKLDEAGVDAFIAEPSASTAYFANVSAAFELSERPFLVIINKSGQFAYLAPKFELGRIAGLTMVFEEKKVIEWAEETSPYEALKKATGFEKIMLDEHARFMIASGLQNAGIEVVPTSLEIQQLRAVKSEAEIAILKGINQFTLQLIRSLQKSIKVGMTQTTVVTAAENLFTRAGIGAGFWSIILFGEQAASPHGGSSGKTLTDGEFVLIDIGSSLHSYGADVTRTILPSESKVSDELMDMWNLVHSAQAAAIEHMLVNETCSVVDAASRKPITEAGLGEFFTHRLGHGLGLEMHEHPYLNGANSEKLKVGEVVTNEPGIYVTDDDAKRIGNKIGGFGVRLEDPILVAADGGVPMTGRTATSPYEP